MGDYTTLLLIKYINGIFWVLISELVTDDFQFKVVDWAVTVIFMCEPLWSRYGFVSDPAQ